MADQCWAAVDLTRAGFSCGPGRSPVEPDGLAFGAEGMDDFAVFAGGHPTTSAHVAFDAPSREAVDAFYAAALEHGGHLGSR